MVDQVHGGDFKDVIEILSIMFELNDGPTINSSVSLSFHFSKTSKRKKFVDNHGENLRGLEGRKYFISHEFTSHFVRFKVQPGRYFRYSFRLCSAVSA